MLEIKDLHVEVEGQEIIKGVSLTFHPDKVHVLMGPNGSGKSTLMLAITGHPKYKITQGNIILDGEDITYAKPEVRAKKGLFLSFQYPAEVQGVTIGNFLRTAVNSKREKPYSVVEFHGLLKKKMAELRIDPNFNKRDLNVGFSGGEKKRAEILQLMLLEPRYAFLDETDSGLDIDAIKIVADGIKKLHQETKMGLIMITHYHRFLDYFTPDQVSVISEGKIIAQGEAALAKKIEKEGFENIIGKAREVSP